MSIWTFLCDLIFVLLGFMCGFSIGHFVGAKRGER